MTNRSGDHQATGLPGRVGWLRSVRARTTLVATAVMSLVLVVGVASLTYAMKRTTVRRVEAQAETEVQAVTDRLAAGISPQQALVPAEDPDHVGGNVFTHVAILDAEGNPVVGSGFFAIAGVPDDGVTVKDSGGGRLVTVGSPDLAIAQRSVEVDGQELLVVAASPLAEAVRGIDAIIRASLVGGPLIVLLAGVVIWTATGRTLRPIERIRTEVEDLSSRTLDRRVPVPPSGDEVARLAETMNRMLARLETASARQREFVSDASHELRSPVASIRTELEVTLAHPDTSSWREAATGALSETRRIERILDDMLLLARLDEGVGLGDIGTVDLGLIVREAAAGPIGAGVALDVEAREGLLVRGRQQELASVVRNLLDNAVRHARSVVVVSVTAGAQGSEVVLTVDDDGHGVPLADRQRVFQRFTRLEHSRSRADGGVGLGLAVVDRVVRRHHGAVAVLDSPAGGARLAVVLPAVGSERCDRTR